MIGSARIIAEAKKLGLIDRVGEELEKIKANGYWIHDDIINLAKRNSGES